MLSEPNNNTTVGTHVIGCPSNSVLKAKPTEEETGLVAAEALVFSRSRATMTRLVTLLALAVLAHVRGQLAAVEVHTMPAGILPPVGVAGEAGGGPVARAAQTRPVTV